MYYWLAYSYLKLNQFQKARPYFTKALSVLDNPDKESFKIYSLKVHQGILLAKSGETNGLLELADKATAYYLKPENESGLLNRNKPLQVVALFYEELNQYKKAFELLKQSRILDQRFQASFNNDYLAEVQAKLSDTELREEMVKLESISALKQIELNETAYKRKLMTLLVAVLIGVVLILWLWNYITKRKLSKIAATDLLTQVYNRRGLLHWCNHQNYPFPPYKRYMWLIDLDNFKFINDKYGHDKGGVVLQEIATALNSLINNNRCLSRWGGEEFLIITQNLEYINIEEFGELLLNTIKKAQVLSDHKIISVTGSVGVSIVQDGSLQMWQKTLSDADKAMYLAKE